MKLAILTALAVSLISGFYHLRPAPYSPLTLSEQTPSFAIDETFFYAPKVNQPFSNLPEFVGSSMMWLFSQIFGSTKNAFVAADFIFPPLIFLILFMLIKLWLRSDLEAALATIAVLMFEDYLSIFPYVPSLIKLLFRQWQEGHFWPIIRAFHPQISLGLFFLFAYALWKKSSWWLMSFLLAVLTYTYFFYWTVAIAWLVLLRFGKTLIKTLAAWLVLTIPYWLSLAPVFKETDYWQRNYFYQPLEFNRLIFLLINMGLVWLTANKTWRHFWSTFYLGLIALIIFTMIFKIGVDDPIGHWFPRVVYPMSGILIVVTLLSKIRLPKMILISGLILLLGFQFHLHWQYFQNNAAAFQVEPERLAAFSWLKANTPKNSVVATPSLMNSLYLPAYTNNLPYLKYAQLRPADNHELLQRFLEVYRLDGYDDAQVTAMFTNNQVLIAKKRFDFDNCAGHFLFFRLYNRDNYYSCGVPEPVLNQILKQYEQTPAQLTYPADFWLGTKNLDFGRLLWENNSYKIYALH